ncbi:unnamed protein product [Microthlaspi erraticum]|uniref:FAS1 domain-containing protein n=1 Tax=Microthlaspi erraticum TaxID=1685480 RepID=A0A6D2HQA2_9BRAS|nr:unnamed protein product [Microthlaspi erraticum]
MSSSSCAIFFFFASTFLYTSSYSFNITEILDQYDDFSTFNALLSQTKLASTINHRKTITVLAFSNEAISTFSGQSNTVIKDILSLHIILDYYDIEKLENMNKMSLILPTLFESSGDAKGKQGFLNATLTRNGDIVFGSAVPGSILNSKVEESVASQPFNVSVLHISNAIMIDVGAHAPTGSSSPVSSPPRPRPAQSPHDSGDHENADSANGVSKLNSRFDLAFALVMSSFLWFMTVL